MQRDIAAVEQLGEIGGEKRAVDDQKAGGDRAGGPMPAISRFRAWR